MIFKVKCSHVVHAFIVSQRGEFVVFMFRQQYEVHTNLEHFGVFDEVNDVSKAVDFACVYCAWLKMFGFLCF